MSRWRPVMWQRTYRGEAVWVEEMFSRAPKWSWATENGPDGRARSKASAMRAAERAVDSYLDEAAS